MVVVFREWGMGSREWVLSTPTPYSPFPTPDSLSRYLAMFDHQSFGHVNDQLTDVGDVIADALQMFGDKQQPGGAPRGRRVARHPVKQVVKDVVVEPVDVVVAFDHRARGVGVRSGERVERQSQHFAGKPAHLR